MKCPKCGYFRQSRDDAFAPPTECPACGIVYVKCGTGGTEAAENPQSPPAPNKRPSAVDDSTLRKARERVERRLRKKTGPPPAQDEQRERTLKRARILAAEGVRKRQQAWQHRQAVEAAEATASQIPLGEEIDAALKEDRGPQAISTLADRLVFVPVSGAKAQPLDALEDTQQLPLPSSDEPELVLDDTISEAPLLVEPAATQQAVAMPEIETPAQVVMEEETVAEESNVIAIGPRRSMESTSEEVPPDETATGHAADPHQVLPMQCETEDQVPKVRVGGLMRCFQTVAWLILSAGLGGAGLSWITLTDVQAGTQAMGPLSSENLSMALLLGFAYLAIGVLGFAFFWVTSLIGGQLAEIRRILLRGNRGA